MHRLLFAAPMPPCAGIMAHIIFVHFATGKPTLPPTMTDAEATPTTAATEDEVVSSGLFAGLHISHSKDEQDTNNAGPPNNDDECVPDAAAADANNDDGGTAEGDASGVDAADAAATSNAAEPEAAPDAADSNSPTEPEAAAAVPAPARPLARRHSR